MQMIFFCQLLFTDSVEDPKFETIKVWIGLCFGMLLVVGSITVGVLIRLKWLGISVTATGCLFAGGILALSFRKKVQITPKEPTAEDLEIVKNENEKLKIMIEDMKHTKIDINSFSPILKLGLTEVNVDITDFSRNKGKTTKVWLGSRQHEEYYGVLHKSFKATLGFDFEKIECKESDGAILVRGIRPENLGFKDSKESWLFAGIIPDVKASGEQEVSDIDLKGKHKISFDENDLKKYKKIQQENMESRINRLDGNEFEQANLYIYKMAQEVLKYCLKPMGKDIALVTLGESADEVGWLSLRNFVGKYNQEIEASHQPLRLKTSA